MKMMHLRTAVCLLTLLSSVGIYSCKRDSPNDTPPLGPATIADFNPKYGEPGTTVVISGRNFDPSSTVKFGSLECTITKKEVNAITVQLPDQSNVYNDTFHITSNGVVVKSASEFEVTNIWKPVNKTSNLNHWEGTAFTVGSKCYLAGGNNNSDVLEFDPATNNWTKVNTLPDAIIDGRFGSVMVKDNKAYMGNFFTVALGATWFEFNPALEGTAAWTRLTDFPAQETYGGIAFNLNNQLYAGLGTQGSNFIAKFDPVANNGNGSWINRFVPASSNRTYISHFVIDGVGYYGGGYAGGSTQLSKFYKFDPAVSANTVTQLQDLPFTAVHAPGYALNGKGYVVIGTKPYEYSPVNNSWTATKYSILKEPDWVQVVNNKAYAIIRTGQVYEYVPKR